MFAKCPGETPRPGSRKARLGTAIVQYVLLKVRVPSSQASYEDCSPVAPREYPWVDSHLPVLAEVH